MNNNLSLSSSSSTQDISALKIESFNTITNKKEDKNLIQPIEIHTHIDLHSFWNINSEQLHCQF